MATKTERPTRRPYGQGGFYPDEGFGSIDMAGTGPSDKGVGPALNRTNVASLLSGQGGTPWDMIPNEPSIPGGAANTSNDVGTPTVVGGHPGLVGAALGALSQPMTGPLGTAFSLGGKALAHSSLPSNLTSNVPGPTYGRAVTFTPNKSSLSSLRAGELPDAETVFMDLMGLPSGPFNTSVPGLSPGTTFSLPGEGDPGYGGFAPYAQGAEVPGSMPGGSGAPSFADGSGGYVYGPAGLAGPGSVMGGEGGGGGMVGRPARRQNWNDQLKSTGFKNLTQELADRMGHYFDPESGGNQTVFDPGPDKTPMWTQQEGAFKYTPGFTDPDYALSMSNWIGNWGASSPGEGTAGEGTGAGDAGGAAGAGGGAGSSAGDAGDWARGGSVLDLDPRPGFLKIAPHKFALGGMVDATKRGLDPEAYGMPGTFTPAEISSGAAGGVRLGNIAQGTAPETESAPGGNLTSSTTSPGIDWVWNGAEWIFVPPGGGDGGDGGGGDGGDGGGGDGGDGGAFMRGGMVTQGDPMSQGDDVPAMLQHGEYVVPRPAMQRLAQKTGSFQQAAAKVKEMILKFANDGSTSMHFKER